MRKIIYAAFVLIMAFEFVMFSILTLDIHFSRQQGLAQSIAFGANTDLHALLLAVWATVAGGIALYLYYRLLKKIIYLLMIVFMLYSCYGKPIIVGKKHQLVIGDPNKKKIICKECSIADSTIRLKQ